MRKRGKDCGMRERGTQEKERNRDAAKVLSRRDKILWNAFKLCKFCFEKRNSDGYSDNWTDIDQT